VQKLAERLERRLKLRIHVSGARGRIHFFVLRSIMLVNYHEKVGQVKDEI
jgi:hypothetical protein